MNRCRVDSKSSGVRNIRARRGEGQGEREVIHLQISQGGEWPTDVAVLDEIESMCAISGVGAEGEDAGMGSLKNIGNTCYLNALLHALAALPAIVAWTERHASVPGSCDIECPLCALRADLAHIRRAKSAEPYEPKTVRLRASWSRGRFNNNMQQCVGEALQALCQALETADIRHCRAMTSSAAVRDAPLQAFVGRTSLWQCFGGTLQSNVRCRLCNDEGTSLDPFSVLTLTIPRDATSLQDLIEHAKAEELLAEDDRCEKCEYTKCRVRTLTVSKWPRVLCIHLVRRMTEFRQGRLHPWKIQTRIRFDDTLKPAEHAPAYKLRSVCVHTGGAESGHYTAFRRSSGDNWLYCDDAMQPKQVPLDSVLKAQAYALFYEATAPAAEFA